MNLIKWIAYKLWSIKSYLVFALMAIMLVQMFRSNYMFQNPIIKKDNYENPIDLHNQLAQCSNDLTDAQNAIHTNNLAATADVKN